MGLPIPAPPTLGRRRLLALSAAALPLVAAACTPTQLLRPGIEPRLFNLRPAREFTSGLPRVEWQLLVETPLAHAGIDTTRIVLSRPDGELSYYAGANWVDTAPEMIQQLLVESFENTNRIVSVGREATGLRSDFVLKLDLRDFQAVYSGADIHGSAPVAVVRIAAKLVRMPRRNITASDVFEGRQQAAGATLAEIIAAFDGALEAAMRRTVEWTLRQGAVNAEIDPLPPRSRP